MVHYVCMFVCMYKHSRGSRTGMETRNKIPYLHVRLANEKFFSLPPISTPKQEFLDSLEAGPYRDIPTSH